MKHDTVKLKSRGDYFSIFFDYESVDEGDVPSTAE